MGKYLVLLHDLDTCRQSGLEMNETIPKDKKLDLDYDFDDDDPIQLLIVKYGLEIVEKCHSRILF